MTLVGKAQLDHPALGTAGGSGLHAALENLWEKVSDHLPARWHLFESVANGATVTYEHGFQVPFGDLRVHIYIKGVSSNSKVADPGASGWSLVATSGYAQSKLDVTAPSSGGPFDFYVYVSHEPMNDKLGLAGGTMTGTLVLDADPTQDLHAATKRYVDSIAQGLDPKASVKVASTANLTLSGSQTIDGVMVSAGDRVLVKNQTTASQNGIYVVGEGAWSRSADMDSWAEVPGAFVFVEQGTDSADKGFVCTADQGGTIGTTAITWVKFTGIEQIDVDDVTIDKSTGILKVKDGGISNTQIASDAAIADSKLATIATPGKVDGGAVSGSLSVTDVTQTGTGASKIPSGTTAQRPGSPVDGMIRYNSDLKAFEGRADNNWSAIGGGGTVDKITQASHGFAVGDVLYLNGSTYTKALNTSASAAEVVGVVSRVVNTNDFELTLSGEISDLVAGSYVDGSGVALGALPATGEAVFLSHVAGKLTLVEPTVVGSVSVPVGVTSGSGTLYVAPKRGVVVGGANARTQLTLANNTTATIQNMAGYDAGELAGWIYIDATVDYRFYVQAQFVKGADGNYDVSYQTSGDTPPAGFSLSMTNAGLLQYTMPNLAGFSATNSVINYALNAPAVGTNFPLSIDGAAVTSGTVSAARLPQVSTSGQGAFPSLTSSLDNATATQLGLKQYFHGTTYNGGNAPTVTSAQTGFSVDRAVFIPYQTQEGSWRIRFNISASFTTTTVTTLQVNINGVTSISVVQMIGGLWKNVTTIVPRAIFNNSSNNFNLDSSSAGGVPGIYASGDIEIASKPTWAY